MGEAISSKGYNAQAPAFNEAILSDFRNYVPNKCITVDDKDPAWKNGNINSKITANKNTLQTLYSEWKIWKWLSFSSKFNIWT